ncbi:hypothetical protein BGX27_006011 [Mortierella sp. AM989]|nr:hypothetical protein BGX27_006011 [Mortierella sp. AM989]
MSRSEYHLLEDIQGSRQHISEGSISESQTYPTTFINPVKHRYRYFTSDDVSISRAKTVSASGKSEGPNYQFKEGNGLVIPKETPAFNIVADFRGCSAGHYSIRWRVKAMDTFSIPNGLHFTANVSYEAESDINGTLDVFMPADKLANLEKNRMYDLELEEMLIVQPHNGTAHLQVALCNMEPGLEDEKEGLNCGLIVERVEIRPFSQIVAFEEGVKKVKRDTEPNYVIRPLESQTNLNNAALNAPITRLVASKSGHFLASLALSHNTAYITVWDMSVTNERYRCVVTELSHNGIFNIPIGLAISASGDQVAVYQEPKIGQWQENSTIDNAQFKFALFNNPLVPARSFAVGISDDWVAGTNTHKNPPSLKRADSVHSLLEKFIGYGGFLIDSRSSADTNGLKSLFVACNGLYLDVFEISLDKEWNRMHSISLADLIPTISRRITCKMMMESISSNTFMWLEDGGICCTVWNLMKGSNISYISGNEKNYMGRETRYSKMAISPSESVVALATTNGTLTTYFASTGAPIDDRIFPGFKIEHVGFHGQDSQLFVVLRNSESLKLSARILDSLQLKSEISLDQVPIPAMGLTILAFFNTPGFQRKGVICEAFGSKINCYTSHQPMGSKVDKANQLSSDNLFEDSKILRDGDLELQIEVVYHREHLPEGLHARYWVHHVKVSERNYISGSRVLFSFVPEPWMRTLTTKAADPSKLMSAYFLPDETRFAIVGMQTIQIWRLPTQEDPEFSLQFIWSQPKEESPTASPPKKHGRVGDYYMDISNAEIYIDAGRTGNTVADIVLTDRRVIKDVSIPGPEYREPGASTKAGTIGLRYAIKHCFKSIHLLAAAYAFSISEIEKSKDLGRQTMTTYDRHAEALIQFTIVHLNRQMHYSQDDRNTRGESPQNLTEWPLLANLSTQHETNIDCKSKTVTLLTLLLGHIQLRKANHLFVKGLLAAEGGYWIPSDDERLNPIRRALEIGNRPLVEAFMDYGTKYARDRHPAYLLPVMQCLEELAEKHPDLVIIMFKESSFVLAHNHGYLNSHMIVAGPQYRARLKSILMFCLPNTGFKKSNNLDDYYRPVFSLRSQLQFRSAASNIFKTRTHFYENRITTFPPAVDEETRRSRSKFTHKVYVCPYPLLFKYQPNKPTGGEDEQGPSQIVILSFAILALYLNLLFELRVFKQLGIFVNIILNITRRLIWFMMILGLFMISFTLALQHLLHTRRYRPDCFPVDPLNPRVNCHLKDYPGDYPSNFFAALTDTYFFLAGRYDPVGSSLDGGSTGFRIMMLIFFMFTAILLLNILIAVMNDAFDHSKSEGEVAWRKQLSEVITEVERFLMPRKYRERSDYFPDYIYYYASEQDAEKYEYKTKFLMDDSNQRFAKLMAVQLDQNKRLEDELQEQKKTFQEALDSQDLNLKYALEDLEYLVHIVDNRFSEDTTPETASEPGFEPAQISRMSSLELIHDATSVPRNAAAVSDTPSDRRVAAREKIKIAVALSKMVRQPSYIHSPKRKYEMESVPIGEVILGTNDNSGSNQ